MIKSIKYLLLTACTILGFLANAESRDDASDRNLEAGVKWFLASDYCQNSTPNLLSKPQIYQRMSMSFQSIANFGLNDSERLSDFILETYEKHLPKLDQDALAKIRKLDNGKEETIQYCQNLHLKASQEFRRTLRKSHETNK